MTEQNSTPPSEPVSYASPDTPGGGYPEPYNGPPADKDAKTMAMLCHLLAIFTGFLGPLIVWLVKKDSHAFVDDQGKEALNFQITCFIAYIICVPLIYVFCLGVILAFAVTVVRVIFCILGTIEANKGNAYRYPITLRLIK